MRALLSTESESGKFDKIVFVIKMTTENEHTASSQISKMKLKKMHKKTHVVGVVFQQSDCVETQQGTAAIQLNLC